MPVAWSGLLLVGWSGVLVPALVRQVESRFGVDDAALGLWYLVVSLAYAGASFAGGRRSGLPFAPLASGLASA